MASNFGNCISIGIAFISRADIEPDKNIFFEGDIVGQQPNIRVIIWNRAMMTEEEFSAFLEEVYKYWKDHFYCNQDKTIFQFFTKELIQEIIQLQKEWVNPAIDLQVNLARIISFFANHLACDTPKLDFLLLLNCLCAKALYFDRKLVSKQKNPERLHDLLEVNKENIRIQSFFLKYIVDLLNAHPALHQEIKQLGGNDAVMFESAKTGFKLLTDMFLNQEIPEEIVSLSIQQQICGSTCFLFFFCLQDPRLAKQVIQKFQPTHPRLRRFLIGRSHITLVLVWRMFHMDIINKLRRIPNSFVAKLMMTIGIFPEFVPSNHYTRRFLSLPMHPK
jgi:hypothetical protein